MQVKMLETQSSPLKVFQSSEMKSNHIQDLQQQAIKKKKKSEIIEAVTTSSLIPVSAVFSTGWCKEACASGELSLFL